MVLHIILVATLVLSKVIWLSTGDPSSMSVSEVDVSFPLDQAGVVIEENAMVEPVKVGTAAWVSLLAILALSSSVCQVLRVTSSVGVGPS